MDGLLVLSRHKSETVCIDLRKHGLGVVEVVVVDIRGDNVRLGFLADPQIPVHRREIFDAIERKAVSA